MKFTWGQDGDPSRHFTSKNYMYLDHLEKIKYSFKSGTVLEIGPGDGKFACLVAKKYSIKNYTLLDLQKIIHHSEDRLRRSLPEVEVQTIFAEQYHESFNVDYDLLVSNICIPETPKEYRQNLLNNVLPNCKSAMIIGQLDETGQDYKDWILGLFKENYKNVLCDLTDYKNCYALIGY